MHPSLHLTTCAGLRLSCPACAFQARLARSGVIVLDPGDGSPHTGALPWGRWAWLRESEGREVGDIDPL